MIGSPYNRAIIMVILGGACLSLLGIADRSMDGANGPQIAFYRAIGQTVFFTCAFVLMRKETVSDAFQALTWRGWFAALVMSLAGFFLIMSFQFTLVANAVFFISLTPLIAAFLAWVFLKESIDNRTRLAMAIAVIGVGIIFGTNISLEGVIGMMFAATMAVCYASAIVTMRTIPQANILLICALNGICVMLLMLPLLDSFAMSQRDLLICLSLGVVQVGLGTVLVMRGAQFIPAAQVSILALIEVVLSPIWVWVFANEVPSLTTLIGGAIVLAGVIYQALGAQDVSKTP